LSRAEREVLAEELARFDVDLPAVRIEGEVCNRPLYGGGRTSPLRDG
jgi:hypothetical protein